jgi:hypothetical protein
MKRGRVVELHKTEHSTFVFEANQQVILVREMRKFLGIRDLSSSQGQEGLSTRCGARNVLAPV